MANTKISELSVASALDGTEVFPAVQGAATVKAPVTEFLRSSNGGSGKVRTASASGAVTIDLADGNDHFLTVTGNVTSVTLSGAVASRMCAVSVQWQQDGTGGHSIANPSGVTWLGGTPQPSTTANEISLLAFWTPDGGTTWYGAAASTAGSPGYSETVGDGGTTQFVINHALGTQDVIVQVQDVEGANPVMTWPDAIEYTDANNVTVTFSPAPNTDGRRINIKAVS